MKTRFKLYKAGKRWLTATLLTVAVGGVSLTLTAYADQDNNSESTVTTTVVVPSSTTIATTNGSSNSQNQTQDVNGYHPVTSNNSTTWQNANGQKANGWQANSSHQWYLFNDGTMQTGWQYQSNNWYYQNPQSGITEAGLQHINNDLYYLNDRSGHPYGAMQTGWQYVSNNWYHFKNSGQADRGWFYVGNQWYYLNPSSAAMEIGLQNINHDYYYLNHSGAMQTGWQYVNNNWYHFKNSGQADRGWLYIGNHWYYLNPTTTAMESGFQHINGNLYYLDQRKGGIAGAMQTGWQVINGNWYHFRPSGHADLGWQYDGHNWYYFNQRTGLMESGLQTINNQLYYLNLHHDGTFGAMQTGWQYVDGNWYFFANSGQANKGWLTLNNVTYYLNPANSQMVTGDVTINGHRYLFNNSGAQIRGVIIVNNGRSFRYYDPNSGVLQTKVNLNGHEVNADPQTGNLPLNGLKSGLLQLGDDYFYFNNGHFVTGDWAKVNNRWYFFSNNGKATKGWFQRNNHWYYFDNNGAAHTGWFKSPASGSWYYFDPTNAWALTGWHYINGNWYYFDNTNAYALEGDHWIYGVEYYFDPTNANMYRNRWVNINGYTGHADNSGHIWYPEYRSQFSPTFVAEGCSVYSLAMLLSAKQYINIPYALSLLQQRQGGNIYSGAGFSLIIQPNSLVDLAHHFDSSVRNITGSSVQDIINLVNAGHPVQYYGYSSYERGYGHKNHNKVIVGYRNGYFRIYDPCYWSAGSGAYTEGRNSYDWGAESWVNIGRFENDYYPDRQAITVD
ncbi:C39 family peptidase [Limosilactobacillus sp.]|uniref:C39 family peptidase n=1 Tax=Limosilactobacillus sp. TaxID=2773925 RepID=UPI00345EF210